MCRRFDPGPDHFSEFPFSPLNHGYAFVRRNPLRQRLLSRRAPQYSEYFFIRQKLAALLNLAKVARWVRALNSSSSQKSKLAARELDRFLRPSYSLSRHEILTLERKNQIDEAHYQKLRGSIVIKPLLKTLAKGSATAKCYALGMLSSIGDTRANPLMLNALSDKAPEVRAAAASCFFRVNDERSIAPLVRLLDDENIAVVRSAAWTLGFRRANAAVPRLIEIAGSKDWQLRQIAFRALGGIKDWFTLPLCRQALKDKHRAVRKAAKGALGSFELLRRGYGKNLKPRVNSGELLFFGY